MTQRRLISSWGVMMVLTAMTSAVLASHQPLPRWMWIGVLTLAALIKGRLILLDYLELRPVAPWRGTFIALLAILLATLGALAVTG